MSIATDHRPRLSGESAAARLADLHRLLDAIDLDQLDIHPHEYADLVASADRAVNRLQSVKLRLVAAAERAVVANASGASGTSAWLARRTRTTGSSAAGQVALATALTDLPLTDLALQQGRLSPDHATVIADTRRKLPTTLTGEQVSAIESQLVDHATQLDPAGLRRAARQALTAATTQAEADSHHDGVLRDEENAALARTRLTLHDNHDGTTTGHFTVPTLAAAILRKAIQQLTSPRRRTTAEPAPIRPANLTVVPPESWRASLMRLPGRGPRCSRS